MFTKANKKKSKLRCALFGPSGSGKTFSALRIAKGMGGKIALIDTERGSASKYADRFEFDVCELSNQTIAGYVEAINSASEYDVLIIDSMSHGWTELLEQVEKLAKAKYRGNTWSAWSEGNPMQKSLVNALTMSPCHIIATMRSKTSWSIEDAGGGKIKPVRVGLAPEQGKGIEYEFDLLLELTVDHDCSVLKDRTGKFQDKIFSKPGEDFGKELVDWLNDGTTEEELKQKAISEIETLLQTAKTTQDVEAVGKMAREKKGHYMSTEAQALMKAKYEELAMAKAKAQEAEGKQEQPETKKKGSK